MTSPSNTRRAIKNTQGSPDKLAWRGRTVRDEEGETIGEIEEIYVADETAVADWALVRGDGPRNRVSFLPLQGSRSERDAVVVPFTKTQFADAPQTERASRLSPEQGAALYDYYGVHEAHRRQGDVRLERAGQTAVVRERRLAKQISRLWVRLLSGMRGHNKTAPGKPKAMEQPHPVHVKNQPRRAK